MPLTADALAPPAGAGWKRLGARVLLAAAAVLLAVAALTLIASLISAAPPPAPVPKRSPFGMGVREAAPSTTGLGAAILALQATFFQHLRAATQALAQGASLWPLLGIGFAYGVFHAAGPGHGKAVIAAYLVANERALRKGLSLSLAAALLQALVAVGLVTALSIALKATAATMGSVTQTVEMASFAAVAVLGLWLTWMKAGRLLALASPGSGPAASCDHAHLPPPAEIERLAGWRESAGVVLAAGLRPCAGAIVVLVFALSQGLYLSGVAATFAMALGTFLTTGALAGVAVLAKALALRLAGGRDGRAEFAVAGLELLAAGVVLAFGAALLAGYWAAGGS